MIASFQAAACRRFSGLSVIVLAAYLLQGYLDAVRTRMLARIAGLFDAALQAPIYGALVDLPLKGVAPAAVQQPLRDLELVRAFLSGMGPTAFLDMPWLPNFRDCAVPIPPTDRTCCRVWRRPDCLHNAACGAPIEVARQGSC